jgi:hypothetical protein
MMRAYRYGLVLAILAIVSQANAATVTYDHTMASWPNWSSEVFTNVPGLSGTDYLNGLSEAITAVPGSTCHPAGCPLTTSGLAVLNDGLGPITPDGVALDNSQTLIVGTDGDPTSYTRLLIDLQKTVNVQQFNSYNGVSTDGSRNYQRYNLYGSNAAIAPTATGADPTVNGWSLIANVATDNLWTPTLSDDHQTGGASVSGIDAEYRYLLFDAHNEGVVIDDNGTIVYSGTHYVELDVVGTAVPEPSTCVMMCLAGLGLLAYAWRRRR